jgi:hypothetical protein
MSDTPSSSVSHVSSTRVSSRSPNTAGPRNTPLSSIQKHTKSRTGCKTCKKRKVKVTLSLHIAWDSLAIACATDARLQQCDEKRPSCGNCVKHGTNCDFTLLVSRSPEIVPAKTVPSLNLLDLELLNNFTTSTYNTLSNDSTLRNIWKSAIVRKALNCEFVMRTLLAISATHIAQHRPAQRHHYLSHAIAYHDLASRRAISLMGELLPENLEDLWIFSVLTMYFALGGPRDTSPSPLQVGDNILPEWIFLFNGVHQIFQALQLSSYSGILSPILKHGMECWEAAHQPEHQGANILHELYAQVNATVSDEGEREIYAHAIRELRCQLSYVFSSRSHELDIIDAFVWHFAMAESFMPLLRQGRQEAVAIFAHSLLIFSTVNSSRWLNGWDTSLLARVWDVLDEEHRLWIQWPIEEIGWMPPR